MVEGVTQRGVAEVAGAGGTSPLEADDAVRAREAGFARDWFRSVAGEVFG